jgi:tetratricopeptide (TPR) repeat protein
MGYFTYYLAWIFLSLALQRPWLLAGVLVFFLVRPFLPDPIVLWRTAGRIGALRSQIAANPSNVTARRDLARIYLDRLRPGAALALLDEARARHPEDAELLFLTGLARLRSGDPEGALEPLVKSVADDPKRLFGEPYRVAAEALQRLKRLEEAEDALERFISCNSSSMEGHTRLAIVRHDRGDKDGARAAIQEAFKTFAQLPSYQRRKELGWWLRAQMARLWI